jgi:hypothetical protein
MVFDNKKTTMRIYSRKMIQAIIAVALLMVILVSGWFERDVLGVTKYQWVILVTLIYLVLVLLSRIRQMNFFYFSDEGDKILIRYHPIHPLVQKKSAIQIPKTGLAGYDIRSSILGLKKVLILRQSVKGKVAIYPPISITSLSEREINLLEKYLDKYVRT